MCLKHVAVLMVWFECFVYALIELWFDAGVCVFFEGMNLAMGKGTGDEGGSIRKKEK